jgi:hypothetical protein
VHSKPHESFVAARRSLRVWMGSISGKMNQQADLGDYEGLLTSDRNLFSGVDSPCCMHILCKGFCIKIIHCTVDS